MESGTSRATEKPKLGNLGRSPPRSPKIQNSYLLRLKFEGVENLESHVQEVENQRRHTSRATDADSPMSFRSPQDQTSHRATVGWNDYSTLAEDKFYGARLRAPTQRTPFSGAVPEGRSHFDDLLEPPGPDISPSDCGQEWFFYFRRGQILQRALARAVPTHLIFERRS